jgi:hypothetical protein
MVNNIIAALERRDRICQINLSDSDIPSSRFKQVLRFSTVGRHGDSASQNEVGSGRKDAVVGSPPGAIWYYYSTVEKKRLEKKSLFCAYARALLRHRAKSL